ncbi:MAG TPA: DUF1415 domain-containing protein [Urbifossiella sp.]|jgi:hypothetical protein
MDSRKIIDVTKRWIAEIVIGLNLCPFARRVFDSHLIRFTATETIDEIDLLDILQSELRLLAAASRSEIETSILIHPFALTDFHNYNDFLGEADKVLSRWDLGGKIQIAGFHPQYQFEGIGPDAVENFTNRSPYPMLHLLREASITEVADDPDVLLGIPDRNVAVMRKLGREWMNAKLAGSRSPRE